MLCKSFFNLYSTEYSTKTVYLMFKLIKYFHTSIMSLVRKIWQTKRDHHRQSVHRDFHGAI